MKSSHIAWLRDRTHRTKEWLQSKLDEGFDLHHIDGNPENNDPSNIVLLEIYDHQMLHGVEMSQSSCEAVIASRASAALRRGLSEDRRMLGRRSYELRSHGHKWEDVAAMLRQEFPDRKTNASVAYSSAWAYAEDEGVSTEVLFPSKKALRIIR
ncbi:MAG: hypothetical protein B7Z37_24040 [Verrucomicrobia bacterium 12-59-8]|nr:MAG: hypothetical protein B7Z37_24040 [Verrucomicrobia bacterium 12-59-8]